MARVFSDRVIFNVAVVAVAVVVVIIAVFFVIVALNDMVADDSFLHSFIRSTEIDIVGEKSFLLFERAEFRE